MSRTAHREKFLAESLIQSLTARLSKCIVRTDAVDFLGQETGQGVMRRLGDGMDKVWSAPRPRTKKNFRSFLDLTGFYRQYVPNYSASAVPFSDLTKNG